MDAAAALATALAAEATSGGGRGPSPGSAPEPAEALHASAHHSAPEPAEALLTLPAASRAKDLDEGGADGEEPQRHEIYLVELHFEPVVLHVNISIQALCDEPDLQEFHPTNKLSGAVRQLTALQDVTLLLEGVEYKDVSEELSNLQERLVRKYVGEVLLQVLKLIGSLELIGNPLAMLSDISGGVKTFIREPQRGALKSPTAFAKGVGRGTAGLVGGVVGGVGSGIASGISAASKVGMLVTVEMAMDQTYAHRRMLAQQQRASSIRAGVVMGVEALRDGVWSGVTGLIQKPVQGAMSGGAAGAVGGLGKGVVGLFAKPLSGMAGLANKVTTDDH